MRLNFIIFNKNRHPKVPCFPSGVFIKRIYGRAACQLSEPGKNVCVYICHLFPGFLYFFKNY